MDTLKIDIKKAKECMGSSQEYLLSRQHRSGFWMGVLVADVSVVADYIILGKILRLRKKILLFAQFVASLSIASFPSIAG